MFELRFVLEGYYTFGEILGFFVRLWIMIFLLVLTAAIIKYHDFILTSIGNNLMTILEAIGPILIIFIGLRILFRAIFR